MSTSAAIPRPWSERQREALRVFVRAAALRAQKESEIQNGFAQRAHAIDAELQAAQQQTEEEFLQVREQLAQSFDAKQDEMRFGYQQQVTHNSDELYRQKDEARARYSSGKEDLVHEFKETR